MNAAPLPEDITRFGTSETFDPASKEGRKRSELLLLKSQPNTLRGLVMDLPKLHGMDVPKVEFMAEGWIPMHAVTMATGIGGGGKTTLMMQLGACVSRGEPWLGIETRKAKALCILTEDHQDICHIRAHHIAKSMGVTLADLPDLKLVPLVKEDTALIKFDRSGEAETTYVLREIRSLCIEQGAQFLMLDALHGLFDGNENDRGQARRFLAILTELAGEIDGAIVLLSHPSKASGQDPKNPTSGSTSWHGGVRSVIHVSDPEDGNPDARTVRLAKANYGRSGEKIEVTWKDGVFQLDRPVAEVGVFGAIAKSRAERLMVEGIKKAVTLGIQPSPFQSARDKFAPQIVIARGGAEGLKVHELARAMNRMIEVGELKIITIGPASRTKQVVVPSDFAGFEGGSNRQNKEAKND